jgi:Holliday junction resolvasome RuvABC DNA-binding subunit
MSNPKMIRGAMGMVMPPSDPAQDSKPLTQAEPTETKSPITSDPEAMDALSTLKRKGYDAEEIEQAMNEGESEPQESKEDSSLDVKAGLRDKLSKLMSK